MALTRLLPACLLPESDPPLRAFMGDVAPSVCTMDDLNMLIGAAATYLAAPWV